MPALARQDTDWMKYIYTMQNLTFGSDGGLYNDFDIIFQKKSAVIATRVSIAPLARPAGKGICVADVAYFFGGVGGGGGV